MTTLTGERATSRRRGRPFRLPEDPTPLRRVHGGVNQRVSWLLATSRIHAQDPCLAERENFVAALNQLGVAADQARVSRWESGNLPVPDRIVVAYEQVLGLTPGKISAPINGLRRTLEPDSPGNEVVVTAPEQIHKELDELFARALEIGHGSDWLALTNYLAVHQNVYLRPDAWTDLAENLLTEMCRSTGPGFTRRFEALRTLTRHPGAQRHVVKAIGAFVTDPDAQSVIFPLTLLQEVSHPRAQELVIQLLSTSSGMLQQGAAWVAATKLARGHFDEDAVKRLEALSVLMIAAGPRSTPEVDIFDVAARLPKDAQQRVAAAVRECPSYPRLEALLKDGEILPKPVTHGVAVEMAGVAQELTPPPYRIEPDVMLQRLIREALFHGHQERRHQAGILLTVSPYRSGVARACAEMVIHDDPEVGRAAGLLLRYLATESERADLLDRARHDEREGVRSCAMIALGRLADGLQRADEEAIAEALRTDPTERVQYAGVYALGMSGSSHLRHLAETGDDYQKRAAGWWLRVGPAIHEGPAAPGEVAQ